MGAKPRGAYVTRELYSEFDRGPVTIAAITFLRYGNRAIVQMPPVPQGIFSVWLEEMKLPPLDDEAVRRSARFIPMLSSEWQAKQGSDNAELQTGDDRFRYDGRFVANPRVLGAWTAVGQVPAIAEFAPGRKMDARRARIRSMTLFEHGLTDRGPWLWSGDTLLDLERFEALKMRVETIDGRDYLFVEAGGFSTRNPPGWRSPWCVLARRADQESVSRTRNPSAQRSRRAPAARFRSRAR